MPIKRIVPRHLEENQVDRAMKNLSVPYCVIIIAIAFFAINVSYETYDDMIQKFSITDIQAKNCIVDFQRMGCRPLNMTAECSNVFACVQKEDDHQLPDKMFNFLDFVVEELQENAAPPTIIIIIMLIVQLTNNIGYLRRRE